MDQFRRAGAVGLWLLQFQSRVAAGRATTRADQFHHRSLGRHWLSDVNAHTGKLRCLITHQTNDLYAARFRATYMKVLRFSYTVPLTVNASNEVWHFRGAEDLGALAGGVLSLRRQRLGDELSFHLRFQIRPRHV
jgi:hypothetical protein